MFGPIDAVEDILLSIPEAVAEHAPWPFKTIAFTLALIVCGILFTVVMIVFAILGAVLLPLWLPVSVYNWINGRRG